MLKGLVAIEFQVLIRVGGFTIHGETETSCWAPSNFCVGHGEVLFRFLFPSESDGRVYLVNVICEFLYEVLT